MKDPLIVIVAQAVDGKWDYGLKEKEVHARPHGRYNSSAAAVQEATKKYDIIINTDKGVLLPRQKRWGNAQPKPVRVQLKKPT